MRKSESILQLDKKCKLRKVEKKNSSGIRKGYSEGGS